MSKECKHEYKVVTTTDVVPLIGHWDYQDHLYGSVERVNVDIFCVHCGDIKNVRVSSLEQALQDNK